jgi:hypothetical protein
MVLMQIRPKSFFADFVEVMAFHPRKVRKWTCHFDRGIVPILVFVWSLLTFSSVHAEEPSGRVPLVVLTVVETELSARIVAEARAEGLDAELATGDVDPAVWSVLPRFAKPRTAVVVAPKFVQIWSKGERLVFLESMARDDDGVVVTRVLEAVRARTLVVPKTPPEGSGYVPKEPSRIVQKNDNIPKAPATEPERDRYAAKASAMSVMVMAGGEVASGVARGPVGGRVGLAIRRDSLELGIRGRWTTEGALSSGAKTASLSTQGVELGLSWALFCHRTFCVGPELGVELLRVSAVATTVGNVAQGAIPGLSASASAFMRMGVFRQIELRAVVLGRTRVTDVTIRFGDVSRTVLRPELGFALEVRLPL